MIHGDITVSKAKWRYALLKVGPATDDNILVEFFPGPGLWGIDASVFEGGSWCHARVCTAIEIVNAATDVARDGVIDWHYKNGTFTPALPTSDTSRVEYNWRPKVKAH